MWHVAAVLVMVGAVSAPAGEPGREEAVRLARAALAAKLGVCEDRMALEEARAVDWPDAAIGCPEEGMMYAQVVTPGYTVRLRTGDATYDVHVGNGRAALCSPTRPAAGSDYMGAVVRVQELARRDLAQRLSVDERAIQVSLVRPAKWPDAGLGCPEAGGRHEPREIDGFLIELGYRGKRYEYHSDGMRVILCAKPAT